MIFIVFLSLIVFIVGLIIGNAEAGYIFREKLNYGGRGVIKPSKPAQTSQYHEVTFAIRLKNLDKLEQILYDISNPDSVNYGKHWTREEIASFTTAPTVIQTVENYLIKENIQILSKTQYSEYIKCSGRIEDWERIFATKFHEFEHKDWAYRGKLHRALEYSLSEEIHQHIAGVFGVTDLPTRIMMKAKMKKNIQLDSLSPSADFTGIVTPSKLISHYHIQTSLGSSSTTQAIISCLEQTVSPSDLTAFQSYFNLPQQSLVNNIGAHINNKACFATTDNCDEANLDSQYITAVGQNVPTSNYYLDDDCDFSTLAQKLVAMTNPPKVISISYGGYETDVGSTAANAFSNAALTLGVMGVSVLAASGDDGAAGFKASTDTSQCSYGPFFPASSPYVTAVGATQGPESGSTEIACQSNVNDPGITSGGGFSVYSSLPSWQSTVVASYFKSVAQANKSPKNGYASTGRGYPDISALGSSYAVVLNNSFAILSGTSASTPVVAGMISLVNSVRASAGSPTLGFLNPFLYSKHASFVWDITSGDNLCTSDSTKCCTQGFYTATGWDPVTGLGSLNFTAFKTAAASLQLTFSPTVIPTASPSRAPSTPAPTTATPTLAPTNLPPVIQFYADQTLYSVNLTAFEKNSSLHLDVFANTVLACLTNEISINITDLDLYVDDSISSSSPNAVLSPSNARVLPFLRRSLDQSLDRSNVTAFINYTVSIQARTFTFSSYHQQLMSAVKNGLFTAKLQILAIQSQAQGFDAARSNNITINQIIAPTFAPTIGPSDDDKSIFEEYLTPIIIGGLLLVVLIIVTMYLIIVYQRYYNNKMMSKIHTYQE